MERAQLKLLHRKLLEIVKELECEIYSEPERFRAHKLDIDYNEVLDYYNNPDNAEEGL